MFKLLNFFCCCEFHTCSLKRKRTKNEAFCKSTLLWRTLRDTCSKAHLLAGRKAEHELFVHRLYTQGAVEADSGQLSGKYI